MFYAENASKLHSGTCFLYKISLKKVKKFPPAAGIFAVEIRLVMSLKCIFFAPAAGHHSVLRFILVYRTFLHKHKLFFLPAPAAGPNHNI